MSDILEDFYMEQYYNGSGFWTPDPIHAADLAQSANNPSMSQSGADLLATPPVDTFLYRFLFAALKAYYNNPNYVWTPQFQHQGTCGGQASKLQADIVEAINSILYGSTFAGRFSVAGMYAGSRVQIGKRAGSWQGTCGSWIAELIMKFGLLRLKDIDLDDEAKDQDEALALAWTGRAGIPDKYLSPMHALIIKDAPSVGSAFEAAKAIQNGNPVIIGCNLIPSGKRNSAGESPLQQAGGHLTGFWACRWNSDGTLNGLLYQNSWGPNWASGPVWPDDQPPCSVWIPAAECEPMIRQRDTYALCGINGLIKRDTSIVFQDGGNGFSVDTRRT